MITSLYEPFRHWSEGGSVFILSDLHFDDEDCKLMDPNWISPEEQISIINKTVCKGDTFVCLGDVGKPSYVPMIKARKKILILGNHDSRGAYKYLFNEIYSGPLFISDKILLSHEPVYGLPWCLNIHGHDHNNMESYKEGCKHINLAANVCGYTPVNLGKIIKEGVLSDIDSIHRITINRAVDKKKAKVKAEVAEQKYVNTSIANDPDITAGLTDDDMTRLFKESIRIDNEIRRIKGLPVAGYDDETDRAYIEYPDGRRVYADEIQ